MNFPKNHENRKFSVAYYQRVLKNGEHFERSWLVYSINNDAVYCFCCRMFSVKLSDTGVAIILDCTPDCSHREEMSIILRFVSTITGDVHEHFIGFIEVFDKTGAGLSERIIKELMDLKININDMRGQSYDNGSNMRGKQNDVQKRILNINPRAFYVPCNSHSLNLVINDAAKSNVDAISFFGIVQKLCFFFSVY